MKHETNNPIRPISPIRFVDSDSFVVLDRSSVVLDRSKGFTLVELMVSLGLFMVVLTLVAVIFSRGLAHQRTLIDLVNISSNASLAMEQMARELRTGTDFCRDVPCDSSRLAFVNAKGEAVEYTLVGDRLLRSVNNAEQTPFVGEETKVSSALFVMRGIDPSDGIQPRITIAMSWSSRRQGAPDIPMRLQTTISPRLLDQ